MREECQHGQLARSCAICEDKERITELEHRNGRLCAKSNSYVIENARLSEALAAAQATIQRMREVVERVASLQLGPNGYCSVPLLDIRMTAVSAQAIPNDRTALDAMLAEAETRGMLKAAEQFAEPYQSYENKWIVDAIRQAAERGE